MEVRVRLTRMAHEWRLDGAQPYGLHLLERQGLHVEFAAMAIPDNKVTRKIQHLNYQITGWQWPEVLADRRHASSADVVVCWDERQGLPSVAIGDRAVCSGVIWLTEPAVRPIERALAHRYLRRCERIWTNSLGQLPTLEANLGLRGRTSYVRFGIDASAFPRMEPDPTSLVIGSAGNDRHRDYQSLIAAVVETQRTVPGAQLELLTRHDVNVPAFVGRRIHPDTGVTARDVFARSAVVVIPTLPNLHCSGLTVTLEAMATGRPVVATATPGMDDYVTAGVTGELAQPGDIQGFSKAITGLLRDPARRVAVGMAGRQKLQADRLTWEGFNDRLARCITQG